MSEIWTLLFWFWKKTCLKTNFLLAFRQRLKSEIWKLNSNWLSKSTIVCISDTYCIYKSSIKKILSNIVTIILQKKFKDFFLSKIKTDHHSPRLFHLRHFCRHFLSHFCRHFLSHFCRHFLTNFDRHYQTNFDRHGLAERRVVPPSVAWVDQLKKTRLVETRFTDWDSQLKNKTGQDQIYGLR